MLNVLNGLFGSNFTSLPPTPTALSMWNIRMVEISSSRTSVAVLTSSLSTSSSLPSRYLLFGQVKDMLDISDTRMRGLLGKSFFLLEDRETLTSLK
jgi:hypothetical protein